MKLEEMKNREIHPQHYDGEKECYQVIEEMLGERALAAFYVGNIIKYIYRYPETKKDSDLAKALTYCQMYRDVTYLRDEKSLEWDGIVDTAELFIMKLGIESK